MGQARCGLVLVALMLCGCGLAEGDREPARPFTASGFLVVDLGQRAEEIRARHPDCPAVAEAGEGTVTGERSDWVFRDGDLLEIAPGDGGRSRDSPLAGCAR
ncbi:hypothetical protein [Mycolicibacterium confluentis]|uniref:Uncharacterized protein n=1 Tax=Mycolicibacterium confluentis TaxID=28047 RepID=A0A7I7Y2J3_9MYCO|nr:hypothetical protein [Mycolicibacterium confluentis]MCV7322899.1 hypothetical protein [Mycolicibacterium confluentis]ORV20664.1 hypothetical protein AWB99_06830 [Mycolicibacterium confluentis]BBZ35900.1 hypothetical protein MCNF_45050 [Mycolicibacterium confluentis]